MKEQLILVCAGGCMREILWQIQELNKKEEVWEVIGYVDSVPPSGEEPRGLCVGGQSYPYLGNDDYLLSLQTDSNVAICVGEPGLRRKIAEKLGQNPHLKFPNLILGDTRICGDIQMGQGCILSMDSRISTNVRLGDFVFLNTGAKICHDGRVGDYATLSPDVTLAGQVTLGPGCNLGMGTRVIQGVTMGANVITGAGSVIIRDVESNCTIAGVPAKNIIL